MLVIFYILHGLIRLTKGTVCDPEMSRCGSENDDDADDDVICVSGFS